MNGGAGGSPPQIDHEEASGTNGVLIRKSTSERQAGEGDGGNDQRPKGAPKHFTRGKKGPIVVRSMYVTYVARWDHHHVLRRGPHREVAWHESTACAHSRRTSSRAALKVAMDSHTYKKHFHPF